MKFKELLNEENNKPKPDTIGNIHRRETKKEWVSDFSRKGKIELLKQKEIGIKEKIKTLQDEIITIHNKITTLENQKD
jgi:hypothetical protein